MRGKSTVLFVDTDTGLKRQVRELTRHFPCDLAVFTSAEELLASEMDAYGRRDAGNPPSTGEVESGASAIACLVSELRLPGMNGLELVRRFRERRFMIPIILVTSGRDLSFAPDVIPHDAVEVLTKPVATHLLRSAFESAMRFSRSLRQFEMTCLERKQRLSRLSDRERQVLDGVLRRMTLKQIAAQHGTSPHTVRNQRQSILQKLAAEDDADLLMIALSVRMHEQGIHWPLLPALSCGEFFREGA